MRNEPEPALTEGNFLAYSRVVRHASYSPVGKPVTKNKEGNLRQDDIVISISNLRLAAGTKAPAGVCVFPFFASHPHT